MTKTELLQQACEQSGRTAEELDCVYWDGHGNYTFAFRRSGEPTAGLTLDDDTGRDTVSLTPVGVPTVSMPWEWIEVVTGDFAP